MTAHPVRIGVVGAGAFGRKHLEVLRQEPAARIVGIADPTPAAAALAAELGVAHFAGHESMLDEAGLDGVIVATPNALHAPVAQAAIARDVPVLVEKPIAETLDAARDLAEAAERADVPLLVGHHRRYNPVIEKAREIVHGGGIGRLTAVAALWLLQKPDDYFATDWRREKGGPVLINLIHDIDDLRFICGEIVEVRAMTANAVRGFAVEDTAAVTLRFACGALGTVTVSDAVAAPWSWELASGENPIYPSQPENCYLFAGTAGSLALPRLELWRYAGATGWTAPLSREPIAVAAADPLPRQLRHFCAVIRGAESPRITGADATRTLAAAQAVLDAAATGRPVHLGEAP
jgi:predicted dehydrogenase